MWRACTSPQWHLRPCCYHKTKHFLFKRFQGVAVLQIARLSNNNPWTDSNSAGKVVVNLDENTEPIRISCGQFARMASGSAVAEIGDTAVMATAVSKSSPPTAGQGFMPLSVDYRQKAAAAGRIPTNYLRRELGPTEKETLASRMIDRSLRPLFPSSFKTETQIMCNLMSVDGQHDPEIASLNAASAALLLSDIPWNGPMGAVRIGYTNKGFVVNPTRKQLMSSRLNLIVAAVENKVVMLDGSADVLPYGLFKNAVHLGVEKVRPILAELRTLQKNFGKKKKPIVIPPEDIIPQEMRDTLKVIAEQKLHGIFTDSSHNKFSRDKAVNDVRYQTVRAMQDIYKEASPVTLHETFNQVCKDIFRNIVLEQNIRCDGRQLSDMRPVSCQVDLFKPLHGSALFQRGQTQVLCTVTFDSLESAAKVDPISVLTGGLAEKNFMLHYEFPPYATNETGKQGVANRRELGHGALAEKALRTVLPEDYPFTIRLTSEVLESNGSSSMATVCGGSLALMDAGVPISEPAAGVAIGVFTNYKGDDASSDLNEDSKEQTGQDEKHCLLTDLVGIEDYMGDMDFKMAGTKFGVTAIQADVKTPGLPTDVMIEATDEAQVAIKKLLDIMAETLPTYRSQKKENAPVTEKLELPLSKRAKFVGPGGYNIKKLRSETGITVSSVDETTFQLFAPNKDAMEEAKEMIDKQLKSSKEPDLEFSAVYTAKIVEVRNNGVLVQIHPMLEPALLHNSQLTKRKIQHPSVLGLEVGQEISVKYFGRDPVSGKMRLSRKVIYSTPSSVARDISGSSKEQASSEEQPNFANGLDTDNVEDQISDEKMDS